MVNIPEMIIPISGWGGGGGDVPSGAKYAVALSLTMDPSTFVITGQLIDQDGNYLGTAQNIDLPLEGVIEQSGAPTSSTEATYVGQFYMDTSVTPRNIYQCTAIDDSSTPAVYTWVRMIKITDVNGEAQNVSVAQNGTITDATTKALITSHLPTTLNSMLFSYSSEDATNYQYYNISFNTTKEMNTITLATINKTTWVVKFYNNLSLNG